MCYKQILNGMATKSNDYIHNLEKNENNINVLYGLLQKYEYVICYFYVQDNMLYGNLQKYHYVILFVANTSISYMVCCKHTNMLYGVLQKHLYVIWFVAKNALSITVVQR